MTVKRVARGAIWLSSSSHFPPTVASKFVKPVVLPPGRLRLATKPRSTGSLMPLNTIGTAPVACCAAVNAGLLLAKITSGARRRIWATAERAISSWFTPQR